MFYSVVGFAVMMLAMLYVTIVYAVVALNTLGEYNIGGVPNTLRAKIGVLVIGLVIGALWWKLIHNLPFTIHMSVST
jgi:hypothetical protein